MAKQMNMTSGKPMRLLFYFALPLMLGNMFQQLYTVVDIAIVGRGVGMEALAALGSVDWLSWLFIGAAQGFSQGISVRISQKYGEGDIYGMQHVIGQSVTLSAIISVIGTILCLCGLPLFMKLLRVPQDLWQMARLYQTVLMSGFAVSMFYNLVAGILRAVGDSKTPLMAMVVAALTNIALDCVAIFVLGWGIAGAAAATVAAQVLATVLCTIKILRSDILKFEREQLKPVGSICKELLALGAPVAAKNLIIALGGMAVQTIVNGFSMSFIAGFTATNKLYGLLEIAAISYGYAVTTYVGQNHGAKQYVRIKEGIRAATVLSVITSIVIAICMVSFGRNITMLFISSEAADLAAVAGDVAYNYLCVMSAGLPILYLLYVFISALQGMGNSIVSMISGIIEFIMRVGVSLIIAHTGFESGIFAAEVAAWLGAAVYLMLTYRKNYKRLAQQENM